MIPPPSEKLHWDQSSPPRPCWQQPRNLQVRIADLTYIMLLNLADIDGAARIIPLQRLEGLSSDKCRAVLDDWEALQRIVMETGGRHGDFADAVLTYASDRANGVERIWRLLQGTCGRADIDDALVAVCGRDANSFCRNLAAVTKLDYSLRFFWRLGHACEREEKHPRECARYLIRLLKRLTDCYRAYIADARALRSGIGIGLAPLMREQAVADAIIQTLLTSEDAALEWIEDEVYVFTSV